MSGDLPRRFKPMGTKSVGCGSVGNSGMVGSSSEMTVKCGDAYPRVCCSFDLNLR